MPIPVDKILAAYDSLNASTDKKPYFIEIKDSKSLADGAKPNTDWEFVISVMPENMKLAVGILCEKLNKVGAPRVHLQFAGKSKLEDYPVGQEIKLHFYEPINQAQADEFLRSLAVDLELSFV